MTSIAIPRLLSDLVAMYRRPAGDHEWRQLRLPSPRFCHLAAVEQQLGWLKAQGIGVYFVNEALSEANSINPDAPFFPRRVVADLLTEVALDWVDREKARRASAAWTAAQQQEADYASTDLLAA